MKTTKISAILSLTLIFAAVSSAFAFAGGNVTSKISVSRGITHHVNVVLSTEKQLCNTYLVEIRDAKGQLVAPPQEYVCGVASYDFNERGPANGIRIARLVRAFAGHHFICEIELNTTPAAVKGPFENGATYRYDLYPSAEPVKE